VKRVSKKFVAVCDIIINVSTYVEYQVLELEPPEPELETELHRFTAPAQTSSCMWFLAETMELC
jgi:hypothetical protein